MKNAWALVLMALLFLAGCEGSAPGIADKSLDVISDPVVVAESGNLTVSFGPQEQAQDSVESGLIRNRARLIVRLLEEVPIMQPVYGDQVCINNERGDEECSRDLLGYGVVGHRVIETFKDVVESALLADGSGSVSITIPPGEGYTLEVLTYFSDVERDLNFVLQYGQNQDENGNTETLVQVDLGDGDIIDVLTRVTFDVTPAGATPVPVTLKSKMARLDVATARSS
jgi:hypothetical protein